MNRRTLLRNLVLAAPAAWLPGVVAGLNWSPLAPAGERLAPGKFAPTWASLQQYQTPDWFRDAKFGIWAHWGPQCQPEHGDWYARSMYEQGSSDYKYHVEKYGHPSKFGFKDVINGQILLHVGYFIMSSPELLPNCKCKVEVNNKKPNRNSSARTKVHRCKQPKFQRPAPLSAIPMLAAAVFSLCPQISEVVTPYFCLNEK